MRNKSEYLVDICGVPYRVRKIAEESSLGQIAYGRIIPLKTEIHINKDLPAAQEEVTLLHEWLHGVLENFGIDHSEALVTVLSSELFRNGHRVKRTR